nr:uncharacterized protein LOC127303875 [Lolium perenne]
MNNASSSSSTTLGCTAKVASYSNGLGRRSGHCRCTVKAAATTTASRSTDYYKVLSLDHSVPVGEEEVKRAYRRLALQYHPDVCPPSRRAESTELFVELRRAYETLSDTRHQIQRVARGSKREGKREGEREAYRGRWWALVEGTVEDGGADVPGLLRALLSATVTRERRLLLSATVSTAPPLGGDALLLLAAAFSSSRRHGGGCRAATRLASYGS